MANGNHIQVDPVAAALLDRAIQGDPVARASIIEWYARTTDAIRQLQTVVGAGLVGIAGPTQQQTAQDGLTYRELRAYRVQRRRDAPPIRPTTGRLLFSTDQYTPPDGFVEDWPAHDPDTEVVYVVGATASNNEGDVWTADDDDWSVPVIIAQEGSFNIIYARFIVAPTTAPAPSEGIPPNFYDMVANVPAGPGLIYGAFGVRPATSNLFTWQLPLQLEGRVGTDGKRPPGIFAGVVAAEPADYPALAAACLAAVRSSVGDDAMPVKGDLVTLHTANNSWVQAYEFNGAAWVEARNRFDGGMIIDGTVINSKIASISAAKIVAGILEAGGINHPTGIIVRLGADIALYRVEGPVAQDRAEQSRIIFYSPTGVPEAMLGAGSDVGAEGDMYLIPLDDRQRNLSIGLNNLYEWDILQLIARNVRVGNQGFNVPRFDIYSDAIYHNGRQVSFSTSGTISSTTTTTGFMRATSTPSAPSSSVENLPAGWQASQPTPTTTQDVYRLHGIRTYQGGTFQSTIWSVRKVADRTAPPAPSATVTISPTMNIRIGTTLTAVISGATLAQGTGRWQMLHSNNAVNVDRISPGSLTHRVQQTYGGFPLQTSFNKRFRFVFTLNGQDIFSNTTNLVTR